MFLPATFEAQYSYLKDINISYERIPFEVKNLNRFRKELETRTYKWAQLFNLMYCNGTP